MGQNIIDAQNFQSIKEESKNDKNQLNIEFFHSEIDIDENEELNCEELKSTNINTNLYSNHNLSFTKQPIQVGENDQLTYIKEGSRNVIDENTIIKYVCDICSKLFRTKSNCMKHVRRHNTSRKLHKCEYCKSEFPCKSRLKAHLRDHFHKKPHKCDYCAVQFLKKSNLISHLRTHTGEKPYTCTICKSAFSQKQHLTSDLKTHTKEKPYICEICKSEFSQKQYLTSHLKTHTKEKPYICEICKSEET